MNVHLVIRKTFLPVLLLVILAGCDNKNNQVKNKPITAGSYYLPTPVGWTTELIRFPIDFAPGIEYKGVEDLRFTRGWGDIISEEHWCYAFTWWLDGKPAINEQTLKQNLTEYYTGLVNRNIIDRKIPENKIVPTVASITTVATMIGDIATYSGTISMLDYHSENPIVLNCMIHVKSCDTKDHTALLFQISPRPADHQAWKELNALNKGFSCGN